jgi:MFS family permease
MWICPECKNINAATSDSCSVCGVLPDGTKPAAKHSVREEAGVTRRFSVGTFLIMIAFFAVLFAVMKTFNVPSIAFCCIAVFFAGIGVAQMALFGGNEPRKASWIAGFPLGFLCGLGGMIAANLLGYLPPYIDSSEIYSIPFFTAIIGGPCGYLAGCLMAGIFLVRERDGDEESIHADGFDDDEEEE